MTGILDRKVDVLAVARDTRTDSTGHIPAIPGTTSVYRIGYEVKDSLGNVVKSYWEKIKFDTIPDPTSTSQLSLTYGSGSTMSHFRYWVTNDPFNDTLALRNWYWNTKQKINQPDSVDAESLEVARFPDGHYWVKVFAYDIRDNYDAESVYVQVANFRPRVKETDPVDGETDVSIHSHIYIEFSESMDENIDLREAISISPGVSGDWIWLSDTEIEFTPDPAFVKNTTYTVSLNPSLRDLQGQDKYQITNFNYSIESFKLYFEMSSFDIYPSPLQTGWIQVFASHKKFV